MNYFLDTCVEIAYVFCTDPWNDLSVELFGEKDYFYYSYFVDKEFNIKYSAILNEQRNFLYSIMDDLDVDDKNRLISLKILKNKVKIIDLKKDFAENKKEKIAEVIWDISKSKLVFDEQFNTHVCSIENILKSVKRLNRGFERIVLNRKNDFERIVLFHRRNVKYPKVYVLLENAGVHYPDICIVLDAHDLSLNDKINLEFITTDNKMIAAVNNVVDSLNIDKFHYLKDFIKLE